VIVVIQCAASKHPDAGHLRRSDGRDVLFVADPGSAAADETRFCARPDDIADAGRSWRNELLRYNETPSDNTLGLLPAWRLYANKTYARLAKRYGTDRLYILSAGWGLISADFLTPQYDITFSARAAACNRRRKRDRYDDLRMLPIGTEDPVVFFVGKEYVPLACDLTEGVKGSRHLFHSSKQAPDALGCVLEKYETRTRTNWHYECAEAFMAGHIGLRKRA